VVLRLELVGGWGWAELKAGSCKSKFVDAAGQIAGGAVDAHVVNRNWIDVDAAVIDVHQAKAEIVDQPWREQVSFRNGKDSVMQRELIGEVQISAAGGGAEGGLQASSAEGNVAFGIREEETGGNLVGGVMEIAIPVCGELIVGELARLAESELDGTAGGSTCGHVGQREQEAIGRSAELIALERHEGGGDRVDRHAEVF